MCCFGLGGGGGVGIVAYCSISNQSRRMIHYEYEAAAVCVSELAKHTLFGIVWSCRTDVDRILTSFHKK